MFSYCLERGTNKKNLSPHEESNLRPSDLCNSPTVESLWLSGRASECQSEGLRFDSSWRLRIVSLSHARDRTKNIFLKHLQLSVQDFKQIASNPERYFYNELTKKGVPVQRAKIIEKHYFTYRLRSNTQTIEATSKASLSNYVRPAVHQSSRLSIVELVDGLFVKVVFLISN